MRIYTRGGDRGKTSLIGGKRRFKDDVRVAAYGSVDESGAFIGLASAHLAKEGYQDMVAVLQEASQVLWDVGADLAAPPEAEGYRFRTPDDAAAHLEPLIDRFSAETEKIQKFVLRGGSLGGSYLHVACTVVRRAEREVVALMRLEPIHEPTLKYLNRLSDLLFVMARAANGRSHTGDTPYRNSPDVFH
ncbi:cob(I)yrinic acid a,c-diamide adenosyltransferase [Sulfobacillus harzensis]|uniref:Corrinoid adenosyltransferase n=1 Tax=Sulfobacillus harzensis TaxID=2729629 RepID=A0A7Y0LAJ1_9FIRM|nr:cob(I)yrinic acid a,c-diamide adenosyltransferase [Sulfobacillus harzensis]NMP24879.1 cob(I)yrinic acid a,c-diamide adenosyltransferase [Sulfobacillus harzensis]